MQEVCPDAWFLNYTNPMAMLSGYMQRYTGVKTVGLCHSVQGCSRWLLENLDIDYTMPIKEKIAGVNHMGWLLEIYDADGTDLYPEIRKKAIEILESDITDHHDLVRYEYIRRFGYYCTESSEHNAEYNNFFIKNSHPELIERYNIPLDEYPRRCIEQIERWNTDKLKYVSGDIKHRRTEEYASYIMEAMVTGVPYKIGGNVINNGMIPNLPSEACVEVACLVDKYGIQPCYQGNLPIQLAAMNMTNINVQLLTIEAARTLKKEHIYHAVMLDPHASSELTLDEIVAMCDEMIEVHGDWMPKFK
jgi:alpha-galactosidase